MARRNSRNGNTGVYRGLYGGDARGLYSSSGHRNMMIYGKPPRRWPKVVLVIVILLIIIGCIWQFACGGLPFLNAHEQKRQEQAEQQQQQEQQAQQEAEAQRAAQEAENGTYQPGLNTQIQITAIGDCTLGTDIDFDDSTNFTSVYNDNNAAYFFKKVKKFTEEDQLTIANLEGPLTSSDDIQEKSFNFKGPKKYGDILVEGSVEAVNLANNHSFDYGQQGYEDTKANLADYNIVNFGYDRTATTEINGIKVGLFGVSQLSASDPEQLTIDNIEALKKEGCALIIGMFHWGIESEYTPTNEQVELAHAAIDNGCDLVLGSHPHVLQGVEYYKGSYICYSLGNFVFGGNDDPSDKNTMMFQQLFTFKDGWLVVDDQTVKSADMIPCRLTSSSSGNNYQPEPLTGSAATKLIKKVNEYSADLEGDGVEFDTELNEYDCAQVK